MGQRNRNRRNKPYRYPVFCLLLTMLMIPAGPGARGQGQHEGMVATAPEINTVAKAADRSLPGRQPVKQQQRPNIIIFLSDDHGAGDAGCYGNPDLATPVIDELAREGVMFTRAYTPVPVCSPSRSALFTGVYPHRNGCHQNHGKINASTKTLPDYLGPLGYTVVLAGKRHIAPEEAFDFTYMDRDEIPRFLRDIGNAPFCLIIAFNHPHQPYFNHKDGYRDVTAKPWLPETKETTRYIAAYYDHVTLLDHELGATLYWIEKYGFSDAFQLYTSDHGAAFPFAKWSLYEQGIRVPFIVRWKGRITPGTTAPAMVSLVDVLPTLVQVAGGHPPDSLQKLDGKSLVPLLSGEDRSLHRYIYAAYTNQGIRGASEYPIRAIRDGSFKLIVNVKHENTFRIQRMDTHDPRARIDSYHVLQSWLKTAETGPDKLAADSSAYKRAQMHWHRPQAELYRLETDPWELNNLADDPEYSRVKARLFGALSRWMDAQGDPLSEEIKAMM